MMQAQLLGILVWISGESQLRVEWAPAEGVSLYQVCAFWLPDGEPHCDVTPATHAIIPVPPEWACLQVEVVNALSDDPPPDPLVVLLNAPRGDLNYDCAVGVADFIRLVPNIGAAPGQPGKPEIVVEP